MVQWEMMKYPGTTACDQQSGLGGFNVPAYGYLFRITLKMGNKEGISS